MVAYRSGVRRLSFLLRPGWIVLALVVVAFAYVCFTLLAPWQLGKNAATAQRNALISSSFTSPPTPLADLVPPGQGPGKATEWRLVTVSGTYQPQGEVLARLRSVDGKAAYEVLTPLRTDAGAIVLVDRGYVRPVVGTDAPTVQAAPAGPVVLQARVRRDEIDGQGRPSLQVNGAPQVYAINAATVGAATGTALSPGYLQLVADQPGGLGVLPLPQMDGGPFLSYGLQWLAFGVMAPLGLAYFIRAELRERKATPQGPPAQPTELVGATSPTAQPNPDQIPDRYGKRR